jgi:hypothetical protein
VQTVVKLKAGPKTFQARRAAKEADRNEKWLLTTLPAHLSLKLFRDGEATQENWEVVCFRVSLGAELARLYFTEEAVEFMQEAELTLRNVYAYAVLHDQWLVSTDEFILFGWALNLTDEMHELTTKSEQMPAWVWAANQMNLLQDPQLRQQLINTVRG